MSKQKHDIGYQKREKNKLIAEQRHLQAQSRARYTNKRKNNDD